MATLKEKIVAAANLAPQKKVFLLAWLPKATSEQMKRLEKLLDEGFEIQKQALFELEHGTQRALLALNHLEENGAHQ